MGKKAGPSIRSRAARRAGSPGLNAGRDIDDIPAARSENTTTTTSTTAGLHQSPGSGVTKRARRKVLSHRQRVRLEKGMDMAAAVADRVATKTGSSVRSGRRVQDRGADWDDVNRKIRKGKAKGGPDGAVVQPAGGAFAALVDANLVEGGEDGDDGDDGESEGADAQVDGAMDTDMTDGVSEAGRKENAPFGTATGTAVAVDAGDYEEL